VILATQEAEIRRITVQSQPGQTVCETLSQIPNTKRAGGVAQGVGSEFKPQCHKSKQTKTKSKQHQQNNTFGGGKVALQQMLLGKLGICLWKTETRSMSFSLFKYQLKMDQGP
jgi:hypothetical protein